MNNATAGRGGVVNGTVARAVKCTAALRAIDRVELERGKEKVTDLLLTDDSTLRNISLLQLRPRPPLGKSFTT